MVKVERKLQIYEYNDEDKINKYFVCSEITKLLGYKNVTEQLKKISDKNKVLFKDYKGNKDKKIDSRQYLINKDGIYEILKSKKCKKMSKNAIEILKIYEIEIQ
jgi:prophage antirepressor-like protein